MKAFRYKRPSGSTQDRAPRNVPPNYWDQQAQWWENALRSEMAPPRIQPCRALADLDPVGLDTCGCGLGDLGLVSMEPPFL